MYTYRSQRKYTKFIIAKSYRCHHYQVSDFVSVIRQIHIICFLIWYTEKNAKLLSWYSLKMQNLRQYQTNLNWERFCIPCKWQCLERQRLKTCSKFKVKEHHSYRQHVIGLGPWPGKGNFVRNCQNLNKVYRLGYFIMSVVTSRFSYLYYLFVRESLFSRYFL